MLSTKKSAQTPVFIAFFPFITIPTAKSGLKQKKLISDMDFLKLDRTAFKTQTTAEAANHSEYYKKITWQERLSITAYLNSVSYKYSGNTPPKMDRNQFHVKKLKRNG